MSRPICESDLSENYLIFNKRYFWFKTKTQRTKFDRFALINESRGNRLFSNENLLSIIHTFLEISLNNKHKKIS